MESDGAGKRKLLIETVNASIPGAIRRLNRRSLAQELGQERLISRMLFHNDRIAVESVTWKEYWAQAMPFLAFDSRLLHRLNRLKKAWRCLLRHQQNRHAQMTYCWKYFSLLHHSLGLARSERKRGSWLPAFRCIVGMECFSMQEMDGDGVAAGLIASRNPIYLLGRLAPSPPLPTAKHVPLVLPCGCNEPFLHYRRLTLTGRRKEQLLMCPSTRLAERPQSFRVINRVSQAFHWNPDPYYDLRARMFAAQFLRPLLASRSSSVASFRILDLGAGTGQFTLSALSSLAQLLPRQSTPLTSVCFVDATGPQPVGLRRKTIRRLRFADKGWVTADYRDLLDDRDWLGHNGYFDVAVLSKVLDCFSVYSIEPVPIATTDKPSTHNAVAPAWCGLAANQQSKGVWSLAVNTVRRYCEGGSFMPQWSLSEYFAAIQAIMASDLPNTQEQASYLPIRRFNPASLITKAGNSVIAEVLRVARSLVIVDHDLSVDDLLSHRNAYGLPATAAVRVVNGAHRCASNQYIITTPRIADKFKGYRLW